MGCLYSIKATSGGMRCLVGLNYDELLSRCWPVPRSNPFSGLSEFLAVAKHRSFRRAAIDLGVTAGAVSQAIQGLESRLRQPLFHRTTRSVALTEAGERLLAGVRPAAGSITESLDDLLQTGARPTGTLRLLVQRSALA